ncbi:hypothetical protein [Formosa sp. S-31]
MANNSVLKPIIRNMVNTISAVVAISPAADINDSGSQGFMT